MKTWMIAVAAAAMLAGPAAAQPLDDPEGKIVAELVVQAREPGPAWWRVSDADTTVWIFAVSQDAIPADLTFDRRYLDRRLKGANALILGNRVSLTAKIRDVPALLRARASLKSKTPMEDGLPPMLRGRFVTAREQIGKPADRYAGWKPMWAGQMLLGDSRERIKTISVTQSVTRQAKREKVPVVETAHYDAVPFIQSALTSLTPAMHEQCLDAALRDFEAPDRRSRAAVEGWAKGRVAEALTEPRAFEKCVLLLGGGTNLWTRTRDAAVDSIAKALDTPGHAVALVSLRQLLAEDGIIEALEDRGLRVKGPGEPD